jgi:hypothetical protein
MHCRRASRVRNTPQQIKPACGRLASSRAHPRHSRHSHAHTRTNTSGLALQRKPRVANHIARQQTRQATLYTPTQHTRTRKARQHDGPRNRNHNAVQKRHLTPTPTALHSAPQHRKHTQTHTRGARATRTEELPGCPASTGCHRVRGWTRTSTCTTHEQPSHHTMAPDTACTPSQSPATRIHRSYRAASIASIMQKSTTVPCAKVKHYATSTCLQCAKQV